jgi:hypothetical protein
MCKRFFKVFRALTIFTVLLVVEVFVVEIYRLKEATNEMNTYMRIANNYALTATQDISNLSNTSTFANSSNVKTTASGEAIDMYEVAEYGSYLDALGDASVGNSFLTAVHVILVDDYNNALSKKADANGGSPPSNSSYIDNYLTYTPLSFNLPYISYKAYKSLYLDALGQMVSNSDILGKPAIFLGGSDPEGYLSSNGQSYSNCSLNTGSGGYTYEDSSHNKITFYTSALTDADIRRIYGNESGYYEAKSIIANITNDAKYKDIRFMSSSDDIVLPYYNVNVKTNWYYITYSTLLRFTSGDKYMGASDSAFGGRSANFINSLDSTAVFGTVDSYKTAKYSNGEFINGQLMINLHMGSGSGNSWNSMQGVTKRYDIIN